MNLIFNFFYRQYLMFRYLPVEIKRIWQTWFPVKPKVKTFAQVWKQYKQFSKNQLFQMLCDLIAEEKGIFNHVDRDVKHNAKKYNSKKILIRAIFAALNKKHGILPEGEPDVKQQTL